MKTPITNWNFDKKTFRVVSNSENGETGDETLFHYRQNENMVTATYSGGSIRYGQLIGLVDHSGRIEMSYQHINVDGEFRNGICTSTPERMTSGKIRLHEKWQWTSGDMSTGSSILEEI